jgi:hypothetical protein
MDNFSKAVVYGMRSSRSERFYLCLSSLCNTESTTVLFGRINGTK